MACNLFRQSWPQKSVYKFKGLSDDPTCSGPSQLRQVLDILEDGKLYFSTLTQLNDPLEYAFEWDFCATHTQKMKYWRKYNLEVGATLGKLPRKEQKGYIADIERQYADLQNTNYKFRPDGIFCSSKTWKNHVLWSHYAEKQAGIAIELDCSVISSIPSSIVRYARVAREIYFYRSSSDRSFFRACSTKSSDWSYEREVRFFGTNGNISVGLNVVKSVTFGFNARRDNLSGFRQVVGVLRSRPECKIYQIERTGTHYGFKRELLD